MAKFLMTRKYNQDCSPITINLDNILTIEPGQNATYITMSDNCRYWINESYEDIVKRLTPFVPMKDMIENKVNSEWIRDYLNRLKEGKDCLQ